jgi:hypothetical protein
VARIRAVVVTVPAMLSDLIASLAPERIDVIAELGDWEGMTAPLQHLRPDLVVIGGASGNDAAVRALQHDLPATKFLTLSADGRSIVGYPGGNDRIDLSGASPQAVVDFLCRFPGREV